MTIYKVFLIRNIFSSCCGESNFVNNFFETIMSPREIKNLIIWRRTRKWSDRFHRKIKYSNLLLNYGKRTSKEATSRKHWRAGGGDACWRTEKVILPSNIVLPCLLLQLFKLLSYSFGEISYPSISFKCADEYHLTITFTVWMLPGRSGVRKKRHKEDRISNIDGNRQWDGRG